MKSGPARVALPREGERRPGEGKLKQEKTTEGNDGSSYQQNPAIHKQDCLWNLDWELWYVNKCPGCYRSEEETERRSLLAGGTGVFPLTLKSTNCRGCEQTKSPMRLWGEAINPCGQCMTEKGKWTFPNRAQKPSSLQCARLTMPPSDSLVAF